MNIGKRIEHPSYSYSSSSYIYYTAVHFNGAMQALLDDKITLEINHSLKRLQSKIRSNQIVIDEIR